MNARSLHGGRSDLRTLLLVLFAKFTTSCVPTYHCDIPDHPEEASYRVTSSSSYWPEIIGATVDIGEDEVAIRYELDDGSQWRATYDVSYNTEW